MEGKGLMLQSIKKEWESYEKAVLSNPEIPDVQRKETRRAFYSGFLSMFSQLEQIGTPEVSEQAGEVHLNAIKAEIEQYMLEVTNELIQYLSRIN